jgi:RNA polymerase sigma-70 factor (ECF subfamily)
MSGPLAHEPDSALWARVQQGEGECFAELVRRYQWPLQRVARSRLGRRDWAEEVVQEAFLAAYKSCASYDPRYGFRTWLWTILLNQCAAYYHRQRRSLAHAGRGDARAMSEPADERGGEQGTPLGALLAHERSAQLETYLRQLSTVQADALRLRFFGGLKYQEIAETMACSLNTAKNRVRWGLEHLAKRISRDRRSDVAGGMTPASDLGLAAVDASGDNEPDAGAGGAAHSVDDPEREQA